MIFNTEKIQESCKKILEALDVDNAVIISEVIKLEAKNKCLYLNVTNREFYCTVRLPIDSDETFEAVVDAKLFLNLINRITTETLELKVDNNVLYVTGNGKYKIPMIYNNDTLIQLPEIKINNITNNFKIKNENLQSVLKYNSKELAKNTIKKSKYKMYYIDNEGAITYTSGACVNNFTLDQPVKMVLNEKFVRLFKLFETDEVDFTIGQDDVNGLVQTKVCFKTNVITLSSIISSSNEMLTKFPVATIRKLANTDYPYSITIDRVKVLDCLDRLSLFSEKDIYTLFTFITFTSNSIIIYDTKKENNETIGLISNSNLTSNYDCIFDTEELSIVLRSCTDQYVTINLGNNTTAVINSSGIKYIIPECVSN